MIILMTVVNAPLKLEPPRLERAAASFSRTGQEGPVIGLLEEPLEGAGVVDG
jgi:hypothetical protein